MKHGLQRANHTSAENGNDPNLQKNRYVAQKTLENGDDWSINGPNCASFVNDVISGRGEMDATNIPWRYTLLKYEQFNNLGLLPGNISYPFAYSKKAQSPRPETLRRNLLTSTSCSTIYTNPKWQGK